MGEKEKNGVPLGSLRSPFFSPFFYNAEPGLRLLSLVRRSGHKNLCYLILKVNATRCSSLLLLLAVPDLLPSLLFVQFQVVLARIVR